MTEKREPKPIPRRLPVVVILLFVAVLGVVCYEVSALVQQAHDVTVASESKNDVIVQLSKDNAALRKQVEKLGATPVAPAPEKVVQGLSGVNGTDGKDGKDGRGVVSFTCQADGTWLVLYTDVTTETIPGPCVGQNGTNGTNGTDGTNGTNGADGAAGQPPASWTGTYTDPLGRTSTFTCTRTTPFDPTNPTYTCAQSS